MDNNAMVGSSLFRLPTRAMALILPRREDSNRQRRPLAKSNRWCPPSAASAFECLEPRLVLDGGESMAFLVSSPLAGDAKAIAPFSGSGDPMWSSTPPSGADAAADSHRLRN